MECLLENSPIPTFKIKIVNRGEPQIQRLIRIIS